MLGMLLLASLILLPSAAYAPETYVEVLFVCPPTQNLVRTDWKNEAKGEYFEKGQRHELTFKGGGGGGWRRYEINDPVGSDAHM